MSFFGWLSTCSVRTESCSVCSKADAALEGLQSAVAPRPVEFVTHNFRQVTFSKSSTHNSSCTGTHVFIYAVRIPGGTGSRGELPQALPPIFEHVCMSRSAGPRGHHTSLRETPILMKKLPTLFPARLLSANVAEITR